MNKLVGFILLLTVFFGLNVAEVQAADIISIRVENNSSRVQLELSEDAPVRYFTLRSPHRLVLDVENSQRKTKFPRVVKNPIIRGFRGAPRAKDYRVVIDLHSAVSVSIKEIKADNDKKSYVQIDLRAQEPSATAGNNKSVQQRASSTKQKQVVKAVDQIKNKKRVILVALDAGHGGSDPGAISSIGIKEKDVVLGISRELERLLDREPGFFSKTIRRRDVYVGLRQRRELARDKKADLFVSIHADAFPDKKVSGASVYVLSRKGATSATAKFLAENENSSDKLGNVNLANKDALLTEVLVDLSMNTKMSSSVDVGQVVLKQLSKVTKLHSPRVEKAAFAVLKTPDLPAILIETGFISNDKEARSLNDTRQQKRIARAIFQGIKDYYMKHPPEGSYIAWLRQQNKATQ